MTETLRKPGYTAIRRKDGTTLYLKGENLSPDQVAEKMAAFDQAQSGALAPKREDIPGVTRPKLPEEPLPDAPEPEGWLSSLFKSFYTPEQMAGAIYELFKPPKKGSLEDATQLLRTGIVDDSPRPQTLDEARDLLKQTVAEGKRPEHGAALARRIGAAESIGRKVTPMVSPGGMGLAALGPVAAGTATLAGAAPATAAAIGTGTSVIGGTALTVPFVPDFVEAVTQEQQPGENKADYLDRVFEGGSALSGWMGGAGAAHRIVRPGWRLGRALTGTKENLKAGALELRDRVNTVNATTERAQMAKENEFAARYNPLEEAADKSLGPITSHREVSNILTNSVESASSLPIEMPSALIENILGPLDVTAGPNGQPLTFSQLRKAYTRLSREISRLGRNPDLQQGLINAREILDSRLREFARRAGVGREYGLLQGEYAQHMQRGLGSDIIYDFIAEPSTAKRVAMLRNPETVQILKEGGVDLSPFLEAENLGLVESKIPGLTIAGQEAAARVRPEGGPQGMKALRLRQLKNAEERYGADIGHLAYPSGRLRLLWKAILGEPIIKWLAGPEEAAALSGARPNLSRPALPPATSKGTTNDPISMGPSSEPQLPFGEMSPEPQLPFGEMQKLDQQFDLLTKALPVEVIEGLRMPTEAELATAIAALQEAFPNAELLQRAEMRIQLPGETDPFSMTFGGGFQRGAPDALPPEVRVAMEAQGRRAGRALPAGPDEPKALPPGPPEGPGWPFGPKEPPAESFNTLIPPSQIPIPETLADRPGSIPLPVSWGGKSQGELPLGPAKTPLEFSHFSTMKEPKGEVTVSGSRRTGMRDLRAVGEEAERLRLGRETGGEFAPVPAVNVYPKGQVGEAHIMAGATELAGRGDYALLDVNSPEFTRWKTEGTQKAKTAGRNDTQAARLGTNYAERKAMEAGYDGLNSSTHPQMGAILFGDVTMRPKGMPEPPPVPGLATPPIPQPKVSPQGGVVTSERPPLMRRSLQAGNLIVSEHEKSGGGTFTMAGKSFQPEKGYAVSPYVDRQQIIEGPLTPKHVSDFIEANRDLLSQRGNHIGTWFDKETGKNYLDISKIVTSEKRATKIGIEAKQKAVWDFGNKKEIRLPDEVYSNKVQGTLGDFIEDLGKKASARFKKKSFRSHAGIDPTMLGDAAVIGAVEIWKGARSYAKWQRAMIDRLGPEIIPHLKKLYPKAQNVMWKKIDDGSKQHFITPKQVQKYLKRGEALKNWYRDETYTKLLNDHFGDDADIVRAFAAILSQGTSLETNVTLALKAYGQWKVGEAPNKLFLGRKNVERFLAGEKVRGMKIGAFVRQTGSKIPVEYVTENTLIPDVVVDRRMGWGFGLGKQGGSEKKAIVSGEMLMPTKVGRKFISEAIAQMGKKYGMAPDQAQASFWKTIGDMRAEQGFGSYSSETLGDVLGRRLEKLSGEETSLGAPVPNKRYGFVSGPGTAKRQGKGYVPKEVLDIIE